MPPNEAILHYNKDSLHYGLDRLDPIRLKSYRATLGTLWQREGRERWKEDNAIEKREEKKRAPHTREGRHRTYYCSPLNPLRSITKMGFDKETISRIIVTYAFFPPSQSFLLAELVTEKCVTMCVFVTQTKRKGREGEEISNITVMGWQLCTMRGYNISPHYCDPLHQIHSGPLIGLEETVFIISQQLL